MTRNVKTVLYAFSAEEARLISNALEKYFCDLDELSMDLKDEHPELADEYMETSKKAYDLARVVLKKVETGI